MILRIILPLGRHKLEKECVWQEPELESVDKEVLGRPHHQDMFLKYLLVEPAQHASASKGTQHASSLM